jgi:hypothetical protein
LEVDIRKDRGEVGGRHGKKAEVSNIKKAESSEGLE